MNFCFHNSKGARRRLARALAAPPRGCGLALLPFWARVAATVSRCYPEVGAAVAAAVEAEFDAQLAARQAGAGAAAASGGAAAQHEEPRLRTARCVFVVRAFWGGRPWRGPVAFGDLVHAFSASNKALIITTRQTTRRDKQHENNN